jgi:hypothetical protein
MSRKRKSVKAASKVVAAEITGDDVEDESLLVPAPFYPELDATALPADDVEKMMMAQLAGIDDVRFDASAVGMACRVDSFAFSLRIYLHRCSVELVRVAVLEFAALLNSEIACRDKMSCDTVVQAVTALGLSITYLFSHVWVVVPLLLAQLLQIYRHFDSIERVSVEVSGS